MADELKHKILELRGKLKKWMALPQPEQDSEQCIELLKHAATFPMSVSLLKTTKIGRTLTALSKKSSCVRVTDSALKLVAEWRKAAAAESRAVKNIAIMTPRVQIQQRTHSNDSELQSTTPARVVHIVSHETIRDGTYQLGGTGSAMRDRVQQRLLEALNTPKPNSESGRQISAVQLAVRMEQAMYDNCQGTDKKYKAKFRDLSFNLKDPRNVDLNSRLFRGSVSPEQIVGGSTRDLASAELQAQRQKIKKEAMDAARSDWNADKGHTDMFRCGRCKKRKCKYSQAQTRSADEPMTTFVSCLNCGNRWKC